MIATMPLMAAGLALTASTAAFAEQPANARAYAVRYDAPTDRYCIRFFSDALLDPRPNNPAPACRTQAHWARHKVLVHHPARDKPVGYAANAP